MVRWSWVNFQCRGVLLVWIRVGQGPTALAVGAGGGCLDIFTLIYHFSSLSPSLWETTRYRLKYCLKGSLSPKTTNQPTNIVVSSPEHEVLMVSYCDHSFSVVRALSTFCFKRLLRRNGWTDFEIILQEGSLGDPLPKLLKPFRYVEQDGCQS